MKRLLLFWIILSIILVAPAQERNASNSGANEHSQIARETYVTTTDALNVGYTFMSTGGGTRGNNVRKQNMQLIYTGRAVDSTTRAVTDCYYVFSLQPKGFVIVAADDRVEPILGYSYDNNFVVENMPAHVRGWLGNYEKQIEAVVKQDIAPEAETTTKWLRLKSGQAISTRNRNTVGPLLTTTWDQGQYYNAMCPEDAGPAGHAFVGCVATAMAQIINYWGYPVHGRGSHSYLLSGLDPEAFLGGFNDYGTLYVDFEGTTYDYDNMPDILTSESTQEEIDAVAQLMYHCGVAVNTFYGPSSSGALEEDVRSALISYFGFAHTLGYAQRKLYNNEEWTDSLKANIDRGEPVFYTGSNVHAFVLDGYNQEDFFHFNFGWSGYGDGWYLISGINPSLDLNEWQSAIMGIRPNNEEHAVICHRKMNVQNNDYFTVTEPIDLYPMRGGSVYRVANEETGVAIDLNLVPEDESGQLVLDVLEFDNEQSVAIYDGINKDSLVRVIETRNLDNWSTVTYHAWLYGGNLSDTVFQNMAGTDFSPIVSTKHGLTVVAYGYNGIHESFHLRVSDASDCRMVSNLTAVQDNDSVLVSWTENGDATQWQVMVGDTTYNCNETHILLTDLLPNETREVRIRAKCDEQHASSWNSIVVNKKVYWTDVVKSEPEGYSLDGDTIRITTPEGLAWLAHCVDSLYLRFAFLSGVWEWEYNQYIHRDISIENDLNLDGYLWPPVRIWSGNLNAHGHVIRNMNVSSSSLGGLFSTLYYAEICDLGMSNSRANAKSSSGSLSAYIEGCKIRNCFSENFIVSSGNNLGGGLIGVAGNSQIINCYAYGEFYSQFGYGGLIGSLGNSDMHNCVTRLGESYNWGPLAFPPESRGLLTAGMGGGSVSNCFSDISNAKWYNSDPETYRSYFLGGANNVEVIENLAAFNISIDPLGMLIADTAVNYTLGENMDVVTALNNKVAEYNSTDFRTWIRDSVTHLPVFGDFYEVTCPNVSNISASNIPYNNGFAVNLSWQEAGDAEEWQIKYKIKYAPDSNATIFNTDTTNVIIEGLELSNMYEFYVRPLCGDEPTVGWGLPFDFYVDKTLWIDVVTSCPEGYVEDNEGNIMISSAEGLAWFTKNPHICQEKTISIVEDIDMGAYRWTPMGVWDDQFTGAVIEGNNHVISNLYCHEFISDPSSRRIGFFGYIRDASIYNLTLKNSSVYGGNRVGSLFGEAIECTIDNCHVINVEVKGYSSIGGLGGAVDSYSNGPCYMSNCSASGIVIADQFAGGLIGSHTVWGTLKNCYANCDVIPLEILSQSGGLIGAAAGAISNCYSVGDVAFSIENSDHFGSLFGDYYPEISVPINSLYAKKHNGLPLIGGELDPNVPISDTASIVNGVLATPVIIGDTSCTNLLEALNAWVDANDMAGIYRRWAADSANVNGGFPVFAAPQSYILTIAIDSTTPYGEVSGGGTYNEFDNTAIISATAHEGCHFVQWSDGNTDNPRTIVLTTDSTLTAQFGFNMYSVIGTASTIVDYVFDFEDVSEDANWTLLNDGYTNRWYINMLDDNRTLYISNDYGVSNDYDEYEPSSVFAYTILSLDSGQYNFSYNWRCNAESHWDYLRVALIPNSVTLDNTDNTWSAYSLPNDAISLDNEYQLAGQSTWANQSGTIEVNSADEYKMVFHWHNDGSVKNVPPAAVDNIHLYTDGVDYSAMGTVLGSDTVPYLDTVTLTAVPNPGYRFVQWDDENTDNPRVVVATNNKKFVAIFECLPVIVIDSIITCDSYSWKSVDYFESTVLIDTMINAAGCDSIVTLYLTINHPEVEHIEATACESYTWNDSVYTQSGDYSRTFTAANGCDSVVTLHLTINHPTYGDTTVIACDSFTWHDSTYTSSGAYQSYLTNAAGCDSIVTLYLTINHPVTEFVEATACDSYTWNDSVYTQSGDYSRTFTAANSCDSVVTLHLTVNRPTYSDTSAVACENFTWYDSTYTTSGAYQSYLTNEAGCDSVVTLHLTINHSVAELVEATACESFTWNGTTYSESGEYPITLTTAAGCDSVVTLHLTLFENEASEFTITTNDPCYTWNDVEYCESGDYTQTLETVHGCDSVVTLHLTIGVGIDDHDGFNFKVYPNPTSNIVNVEFGMDNGELGDVKIQLYDVFGKLLDVTNVVGANNHSPLRAEIDLSRYANGVYIIKLVFDRDGRILGTQKIVKQ